LKDGVLVAEKQMVLALSLKELIQQEHQLASPQQLGVKLGQVEWVYPLIVSIGFEG